MNVQQYVQIAKRRWSILLLCGAGGFLIALIATFLSPRVYQSSATMYVSARITADNAQAAYQGSLLSEQRVKSYTALVSGERVASEVASRLALPEAPSDVLNRLSASSEPNTVLITISATDRTPEAASSLANTAASVLSELVADVERPRIPTQDPPVSIRVVQPAVPDLTPVSPRPLVNILLGLVVGLLAGAAVALVRDSADTTVESGDRLAEVAGVPTLGQCPVREAAKQDHSAQGAPERSGKMGEELRRVRANLQYMDVDHPSRIVLVTSAVPAEGKTTISAGLSETLVASGAKVLLLECDLRRPTLAASLGLESAVGLTTVLLGQLDLREAVQRANLGSLDVLVAGPLPPNPSELLGSTQMTNLLNMARSVYDHVIIDGPPTLPVSDTLSLCVKCDGVVVVCRQGQTTGQQVQDCISMLSNVGGKILGTVLNFVTRDASNEDSYSRYYTQSSYSKASDGENRRNRTPEALNTVETAGSTLGQRSQER